jgi:hypothetical protein
MCCALLFLSLKLYFAHPLYLVYKPDKRQNANRPAYENCYSAQVTREVFALYRFQAIKARQEI